MKYVPILAFLIFFSSVLEASYARSIRVGSFLNERHAEKELVKLKDFVHSNSRLNTLQDKYQFEVKLLVRGKYYLNVIEPLMKKPVVQEILDILRTKYSYVYPKKIRYLPEYANYGKKEEVTPPPKEDVIDDSELLEKVDKILQNGKINEDDIPAVIPNKQKYLPQMEEKEDESIFSKFLNLFSSDKKEIEEIKAIPKERTLKVEDTEESSDGILTTLGNYILEILLVISIIILVFLLKSYITYKKESKNKISMQDIYS